MRLDRFISNATDLSRAEVKRLIRAGLVEINGEPAVNPARHLGEHDEVAVEGVPIVQPRHRYFMLHKPAGVVSAAKDSDHPTAVDLLHEHRNHELQIAGRLDIDTTGLLLLTDDGQWNHRVTAPRAQCDKTYLVRLAAPIEPHYADRLAHGIWLPGEKRRCLPAAMEAVDAVTLRLTIAEGKFHQVKRMFEALDNAVTALHRERIGEIVLDPALAPGEYRALTRAEIDSV